jgi:hypothetical protein
MNNLETNFTIIGAAVACLLGGVYYLNKNETNHLSSRLRIDNYDPVIIKSRAETAKMRNEFIKKLTKEYYERNFNEKVLKDELFSRTGSHEVYNKIHKKYLVIDSNLRLEKKLEQQENLNYEKWRKKEDEEFEANIISSLPSIFRSNTGKGSIKKHKRSKKYKK